jgi:hypothetical protein
VRASVPYQKSGVYDPCCANAEFMRQASIRRALVRVCHLGPENTSRQRTRTSGRRTPHANRVAVRAEPTSVDARVRCGGLNRRTSVGHARNARALVCKRTRMASDGGAVQVMEIRTHATERPRMPLPVVLASAQASSARVGGWRLVSCSAACARRAAAARPIAICA